MLNWILNIFHSESKKHSHRSGKSRRKSLKHLSLHMESLEDRSLMSATPCGYDDGIVNINTGAQAGIVAEQAPQAIAIPNLGDSMNNASNSIPAGMSIPNARPNLQVSNGGRVTKNSSYIDVTTGTIKNTGSLTANAGYKITIYASTDSRITTSDKVLGTYTATSSRGIGKSTTLSVKSVPIGSLSGGNYYIGWIISGVKNETVTSNNTGYCSTRLNIPYTTPTSKPDLQASNGGTFTVSGSYINVTTGTIKNVGKTTANSGYKITVYASTDKTINTSDKALKTFTITSSLAAGKSTSFNLSSIPTAGLAKGKYYIGWIISGVNGETVTYNNTGYCTSKQLVITTPNSNTNNNSNNNNKIDVGDKLSFTTKNTEGSTVFRTLTFLSSGKVKISDKTSQYGMGVPMNRTSYSTATISYSGNKATIKYTDSKEGYQTLQNGKRAYFTTQYVTINLDFSTGKMTYKQTSLPSTSSSFTLT